MFATVSVILPAAIIVGAGYYAGRRILDAAGVKALSELVFNLFLPCLLFRSMATSSFAGSDLTFLLAYFGASLVWFAVVALFYGRRLKQSIDGAVVLGLGAVFSNTVQLGIPIQKLAFGDAGLKLQLSIIALHSLVLLTTATIWVEIGRARANASATGSPHSAGLVKSLLHVTKASVIHPVILPIIIGLLWSFAGWPLPEWADQPLGFLASAAGPMMLVLMGAQLSNMKLSEHWREAMALALMKNLLHPLLIFAVTWGLGLSPLAIAVAVTCAALPMGANVFLFAQRYNANESLVTAATALSSLIALVSLTVVLALVPRP
jgi:malonate transporter and related proteins